MTEKEHFRQLIKTYQIGFDAWGFALFVLLMLPTVYSHFLPPENDLMKLPTHTPELDVISAVIQIIAVAALCMMRNSDGRKPIKIPYLVITGAGIAAYYICWGLYYQGITEKIIFMLLAFIPSVTLMIFSSARKNIVAFCAFLLFFICHMIFTVMNFVI